MQLSHKSYTLGAGEKKIFQWPGNHLFVIEASAELLIGFDNEELFPTATGFGFTPPKAFSRVVVQNLGLVSVDFRFYVGNIDVRKSPNQVIISDPVTLAVATSNFQQVDTAQVAVADTPQVLLAAQTLVRLAIIRVPADAVGTFAFGPTNLANFVTGLVATDEYTIRSVDGERFDLAQLWFQGSSNAATEKLRIAYQA